MFVRALSKPDPQPRALEVPKNLQTQQAALRELRRRLERGAFLVLVSKRATVPGRGALTIQTCRTVPVLSPGWQATRTPYPG